MRNYDKRTTDEFKNRHIKQENISKDFSTTKHTEHTKWMKIRLFFIIEMKMHALGAELSCVPCVSWLKSLIDRSLD